MCNKLTISSDLPPGAQLDDVASLLTLDAMNIDVEKLGWTQLKSNNVLT